MSGTVAPRGTGVDPSASVGDRTVIHRLARVAELVRVGSGCTIGAGAFIGRSVLVGRNCLVLEDARLQESTLLEDGVTIGAAAVIANRVGEHVASVTVRNGAVIGARARCVGPAVIGRWAVVEADALVTGDVPDFAVVAGSPARRVGWSGRAGARLERQADGGWRCPDTGERYVEQDGRLRLADAG